MTDKEMTLALGHYINSLLAKIAAMQSLIPDCQQDDVNRIQQEPAFRRLSDRQSSALLQAVGDCTQAPDLIRSLCKHYLQ
jgi:hypothetical protein